MAAGPSGAATSQGALAERNSFGTAGTLAVGDERYAVHRVADIAPDDLPMTLRILLENLLRHEDGERVTAEQVQALLAWGEPGSAEAIEVSPARVFLHDTNGVPALVDLAAMRDAAEALGADSSLVNPTIPAELVVDHSVIADVFGRAGPSSATSSSSTPATPSATGSSSGRRERCADSRSSRPARGSCTRSTWSTSPGS